MEERRFGLRPLKTVLCVPKVTKSNSERCVAYRNRLKQDPERYEEFKARQKEATDLWLLRRTDEKKLADRDAARLRKQKSRALKKQNTKKEDVQPKVASKPSTRADTDKKTEERKRACERKRKSRLNMSTKKKQGRNKKRMDDYYRKKEEEKERNRKRDTEEDRFVARTPGYLMRLKTAYKDLSQKRDKESLTKLAAIKSILQNTKETHAKKLYKRRQLGGSDQTVESFYDEVSIDLPGKRTVMKHSMKQKKVLTKKIADVFKEFKAKHPNYKISLTAFLRRRPRHIMLSSSRAFNQCLCERCVNPMLKMEKLNPFLAVRITNVDQLVDRTVCGIQEYRRQCVDQNCSSCGVIGFVEGMRVEVEEHLNKPVTWYQWQQGEGGLGKDKVEVKGTLEQLIAELEGDMKGLALHLKTARWQREQYRDLCSNLPPGCAVVTIDFAENYLCQHQNEISSSHWNYKQVSVHPCVLQYKSHHDEDDNSSRHLITEYKVFLSDDLCHDAAFAKTVIQRLCTHLEAKGISRMYIFSDGCAAQYKSKLPFVHLTELARDNPNLTIERHFFGSHHGKSLCDSCGGVVKSCASNAVKSGRVCIQSAAQMLKYCAEEITLDESSETFKKKHNLRSFELVCSKDIEREVTSATYNTLHGTRSLHAIRPDPAVHRNLHIKNLSCFCIGCLQQGNCINSAFTGTWIAAQVPVHSVKQNVAEKGVLGKRSAVKRSHGKSLASPAANSATPTKALPTSPTKTPPTEEPEIALPASPTKTSFYNDPPTEEPELASQQRIGLFRNLHGRLAKSSSFLDLQTAALDIKATLDRYPLAVQEDLKAEDFKKDKTSALLYPSDGPRNLQPTTIFGDGNCLPRCGSVLAFGNEQHHLEMRVRVVVELVLGKERYLSPNLSSTVHDLPRKAGQYSQLYGDEVLTPFVLDQLYEKDVLHCVKANSYMGVWQLYALSSVLGIPLHSVYPEGVGHNVRADVMQIIFPANGAAPRPPTYGIMWTHTQGRNAPAAHWGPNHFVVCLPITNPGSRLSGGDIVLVEVHHQGEKAGKTVYPAQITRDDGDQAGAWGVFLRKSTTSRNSWVLPDPASKEYFLPLNDIQKILEDYTLLQEGRSVVCTFAEI